MFKRHAISDALWESVVEQLHILDRLNADEIVRPLETGTPFLAPETPSSAPIELQIDDTMRVMVAWPRRVCRS